LDEALLMLLFDEIYAPGICCRRPDTCRGFGSFGDLVGGLVEPLAVSVTCCVNSRVGGGSTAGHIFIVDIDFLRSSASIDTLRTISSSILLAGEGCTAFREKPIFFAVFDSSWGDFGEESTNVELLILGLALGLAFVGRLLGEGNGSVSSRWSFTGENKSMYLPACMGETGGKARWTGPVVGI